MQKTPSYFDSIGITEFRQHFNAAKYGVDVVIVETGSEPYYHRDLNHNLVLLKRGTDSSPSARNHITAVSGVIGADDNDIGYVGVSPSSVMYYYGLDHDQTPDSLALADDILFNTKPGDIVAFGISTNVHYPLEFAPDFTAGIQKLVDYDRVVIELAGNGYRNIDTDLDPEWLVDTGAIVVGNATYSENKWMPALSSTHGSRLTISAPGTNIEITYDNTGNPELTETGFSGTSAAYPVVAGICSMLQRMNLTYNGDVLNSQEMAEILAKGATELDFTNLPDREGLYGAGLINIMNSAKYITGFGYYDYNDDNELSFSDFSKLAADVAIGRRTFSDFTKFASMYGTTWPADHYEI